MQVSEGLTITLYPNSQHEFLMTTRDVANGYDVSENTLRGHRFSHKKELIENKHFVKGVCITNTFENGGIQPHKIFWTKQGVIRLGFFIKSERAKLFRDWVEQLVVNYLEKKLPALPETPKRKHNRLTQDRLLVLMKKICLIEDNALRKEISDLLLD